MLRLQASKGLPPHHKSLANQAVSGRQGSTVQEAGSGWEATSSSFTSCGTPSTAAPVNSSEPPIMRWKCEIGTIFDLERPCISE